MAAVAEDHALEVRRLPRLSNIMMVRIASLPEGGRPPVDEYAQFVEHPRYGRRPRLTGLNPTEDLGGTVFHWHSRDDVRVPNTAIRADLSKQPRATVAVTHYFDVKCQCQECGKPFLFFAEEQRHWYEELGFPLEADCVRCVQCRKRQQGLARTRERYEELFHVTARTSGQQIEFAECCLTLVEGGMFHARQLEHVRALLKGVPPELDPPARARLECVWARVRHVEQAAPSPECSLGSPATDEL